MTKVTLREKPINNGRLSLYLDYYPSIIKAQTGQATRREFLKIYIYGNPKNQLEKNSNKENKLLAQQICQKRQNELNKPEIYTDFERERLAQEEKGEISFLDYYARQMDKRHGKNYAIWNVAFKYLKDFTKTVFPNGNLKFKDLDQKFCNDYKDYLLKAPSKRSIKTTISNH